MLKFCYYLFTIPKIDSKTNMKKKTLHRNTHPFHWHGSMLVAIAAILLTSVKCSSEMLRALQALPTPPALIDSTFLRDAETGHSPIILEIGTRHSTASGK
jgi:hypothetical protein